jgi:hypothetical protein
LLYIVTAVITECIEVLKVTPDQMWLCCWLFMGRLSVSVKESRPAVLLYSLTERIMISRSFFIIKIVNLWFSSFTGIHLLGQMACKMNLEEYLPCALGATNF